ncbi:3-deoxy-D-manno-octulosonate 8-phosphate phosphatase, YrbI family [Thermovibrio ammonificans HB-1]|uniref:3-deoxy-D-manno-octulosonate 8-phosphate phosphatase, YrbI family n=1 Tax=Thermovibrio ammonificans (strain DSM 15698 / JCM 12110 / HB-1) TaxID=648996 RepID=E8T2M3_THEA1|nr:HAD-IIIA family hydrolase [Thermovibrio ammonificans]ADU97118.1 3-deoxy-D-manno-octulosonate 8-phosphate phosphatase, YrbI family [Thermovibrio ammonificans HB-1]
MIKALILDVDGVLTDGTITYDIFGRELKSFNVKDGYGIVRALNTGIEVILISGRFSSIVEKRFRELGVTRIYQGVSDKLSLYQEVKRELSLNDAQIAAMGDDLPDLPLLKRVGVSGAPKDAVPEVKVAVNFVSRYPGGKGAVREFIDYLIKERVDET